VSYAVRSALSETATILVLILPPGIHRLLFPWSRFPTDYLNIFLYSVLGFDHSLPEQPGSGQNASIFADNRFDGRPINSTGRTVSHA